MGRGQVSRCFHLAHNVCVNILARVSQSEWVAELEFRATGPERGGGNLELWYAKDGRTSVGTSSVYTVGNYDGMVLVMDPYGGKVRFPWGNVRGYMLILPGWRRSGIHE